MIWIPIWKITLIVALLMFAVLSLAVIIGGAKELYQLLNQRNSD